MKRCKIKFFKETFKVFLSSFVIMKERVSLIFLYDFFHKNRENNNSNFKRV
jgi:hypothetical protein